MSEELLLPDHLNMILSDFYKTLSDPSRLKIIYSLTKKELCVQEICDINHMNQTAVSYQLRILRGARLVKYRRDGKQIFYSIDDEHINKIVETTIEHIKEKM